MDEASVRNTRLEKEEISEREKFLRDKLFSIHIFVSKTVLTLSSATLALSVGFKGFINIAGLEYTGLLPLGWAFLIAAVILQMFMIKHALGYYYGCYNNFSAGIHEHTDAVLNSERGAIRANRFSFWAWLIGTVLILTFIYLNLGNST